MKNSKILTKTKQVIKKSFNTLKIVLTGVVLCFISGILILQLLGYKPYVVMSGSMEPAIHTGSVCFIDTNAKYSEISVDDIIAFKTSTMEVTHRVISINNEGLETKGDANENSDGITTTKNNFIGKNVFSIPYIGYISKMLQTKKIQIIGISLIMVFVLGTFLIKDKNNDKV